MSDITGALDVRAFRSPFQQKAEQRTVPAGLSIEEILKFIGIDDVLAQRVHVFLGGEYIPAKHWHGFRPKVGHQLAIKAFIPPEGGGGSSSTGGKDILRTVLIIAVAAGAIAFGPALGAAVGLSGALAASVGQAVIGIGGMLLVNALIPPRTNASSLVGQNGSSDSATQFIESARNHAANFSALPVLFGKTRIVPLYGTQPYTTTVGDDQYLSMLFVWGTGPIFIDTTTLKIGDTLLSNFAGVQINHYAGYSGDAKPSLIPSVVLPDSFQIDLLQAAGYTVRTSGAAADETTLDFVFGQGLITVNSDGSRANASVTVQVQQSVSGSGVWNSIPIANGQQTFDLSWTNQSGGSFDQITFTQQKTAAIRHGLTFKNPTRGQYDIRVRRLTADTTDPTIRDVITWTGVQSITNESPVQSPVPVAMTEMRIKASNQLNGVIDEFNGVCTAIANDWNGAAWVAEATQNPAAAYRLALQSPSNAVPKTDDQIDLVGLEYFSEFCVTHGFKFNQLRDFYSSQWDLLQDICAAGRASASLVDGKYSVVIEEPKTPVSHITPRNSTNFKMTKAFVDPPDGIRVTFNNEDQNWNTDEHRIYLNGKDATTAQTFETMEFPGVTDPNQIAALTLFNAACAIQRPEQWTYGQDMERLVYRRGDVVNVTHDVLLVGLASGRISSVVLDGSGNCTGVTTDEALPMTESENFGISIRTAANVTVTAQVQTEVGEQHSITFVTPIPAADAPAEDNLFGFGILGQETDQGLILGIEPDDSENLSASITCCPYRASVYTADSIIPPFDSRITAIPPIPSVVVSQVRSDETVLTVGSGNSLEVNISVKVQTLSAGVDGDLHVQIRPTGNAEPFTDALVRSVSANEVLIGDVRSLERVDMAFRWEVQGRQPGAWTYYFNYLVVGKSTNPAALQGMTGSTFGGQAFIRWDAPSELDVLFGGTVQFRYSADPAPEWGNSVSIGDVAQAKSLLATLPLKDGRYLARVFDNSGNFSDVSIFDTKQASVLTYANVNTLSESPGFTGTRTGVDLANVGGSNALFVASASNWDDIPDLDGYTGQTDFYGGAGTTGTYVFALGFDFGSVIKVRLTTIIGSFNAAIFDDIDGWGLIDSRTDFDGVDTALCDCKVYVSLTDDNPAGSPTWGAYQRLDSSEVETRGCRFKAILTSANSDFNIFVNGLGITAEAVT